MTHLNLRLFLACLVFALLVTGCAQNSPGESTAALNQPASARTTAPTKAKIPTETSMPTPAGTIANAFEMNRRIGRGMNLGNALEGPTEGSWGVTLQADYFKIIKDLGFQSVRVPIRWNAHAAADAPYAIDPKFFERIDWVVEQALSNDLVVILNIHHFEEFVRDPVGQRARYRAIWKQIAERYTDTPETVVFELLNEPNGDKMTASVWNELAAAGLEVVRESNPDRYVIIGPVSWNSVDQLHSLRLPEDDRRIIATFHYYQPFHFTHQGAEWQQGSDAWLGTRWTGTPEEKAAVTRDLKKASDWSERNDRPVYMGEFGAYSKADMDSRARWTAFVAREAERLGLSWAYWEFAAGFGIYDPVMKSLRQPLVEALVGD